jgi:hypothetical protein
MLPGAIEPTPEVGTIVPLWVRATSHKVFPHLESGVWVNFRNLKADVRYGHGSSAQNDPIKAAAALALATGASVTSSLSGSISSSLGSGSGSGIILPTLTVQYQEMSAFSVIPPTDGGVKAILAYASSLLPYSVQSSHRSPLTILLLRMPAYACSDYELRVAAIARARHDAAAVQRLACRSGTWHINRPFTTIKAVLNHVKPVWRYKLRVRAVNYFPRYVRFITFHHTL